MIRSVPAKEAPAIPQNLLPFELSAKPSVKHAVASATATAIVTHYLHNARPKGALGVRKLAIAILRKIERVGFGIYVVCSLAESAQIKKRRWIQLGYRPILGDDLIRKSDGGCTGRIAFNIF
jgi:hypothetical protein